MKILTQLPDRKHFALIPAAGSMTEKSRYIFQDRATDRVRIISPHPNPWNSPMQWVILWSPSKGKSDKAVYVNRLDLKLYVPELNESIKPIEAVLIREQYKASFPYSNERTLKFAGFPLEIPNEWLSYCVIQ